MDEPDPILVDLRSAEYPDHAAGRTKFETGLQTEHERRIWAEHVELLRRRHEVRGERRSLFDAGDRGWFERSLQEQ